MTQNCEYTNIRELGVLIRPQKISPIEVVRNLGYPMSSTAAPFVDLGGGISSIEADKGISGQAFKDIDILLLPTTTTTVPTIKDAGTNPQALSARKYRLRQLLWPTSYKCTMRF